MLHQETSTVREQANTLVQISEVVAGAEGEASTTVSVEGPSSVQASEEGEEVSGPIN